MKECVIINILYSTNTIRRHYYSTLLMIEDDDYDDGYLLRMYTVQLM